MEERNDLKSIIAGLVIIIVGVVAILIDLFWLKTDRSIWISIGCSLLASGIVILAQLKYISFFSFINKVPCIFFPFII